MTITRTVKIPVSRRLVINVPREIPAGRVVVTFTPAAEGEMDATEYLVSSPVNRERLDRAIENIERGKNLVMFESAKRLKRHAEELSADYRNKARPFQGNRQAGAAKRKSVGVLVSPHNVCLYL